jgi:hypothetical protein
MTETSAKGAATDAPAPAEAPTDYAARAELLERRIAELEAAHASRMIRSELRSEAVRHGLVDMDCLKLIDGATVSVGADGEVRGAATALADLKKSKPWLFAGAGSSSTAAVPPAQAPKHKTAREMSHAEWQAARADLIKRR